MKALKICVLLAATFLVVSHAPPSHKSSATGDDASNTFVRKLNVLQPEPCVYRKIINALLGLFHKYVPVNFP